MHLPIAVNDQPNRSFTFAVIVGKCPTYSTSTQTGVTALYLSMIQSDDSDEDGEWLHPCNQDSDSPTTAFVIVPPRDRIACLPVRGDDRQPQAL